MLVHVLRELRDGVRERSARAPSQTTQSPPITRNSRPMATTLAQLNKPPKNVVRRLMCLIGRKISTGGEKNLSENGQRRGMSDVSVTATVMKSRATCERYAMPKIAPMRMAEAPR